MAEATVTLLARIYDETNEKWVLNRVPVKAGKPLATAAKGAGRFYLRYSDVVEAQLQHRNREARERAKGRTIKPWSPKSSHVVVVPVGDDLTRAFNALKQKMVERERIDKGLAAAPVISDRKTIAEAVNEYNEDNEARKAKWFAGLTEGVLAPRSVRKYRSQLSMFQENSGVTYLDEINAKVLLAYEMYLVKNLTKRAKGSQNRTIADNFMTISGWLTFHGIRMVKDRRAGKDANAPGIIKHGVLPRVKRRDKESKEPESYSPEELDSMMAVATVDEGDLIQTFLRTGFRAGEIEHLIWSDVDFKKHTVTTSDKLQFNWRMKDYEVRTIPMHPSLQKRLTARLDRMRKEGKGDSQDLVFPTAKGTPDGHHIRILHRVVKRAIAAGHEFEHSLELHNFRKTYAQRLMIAELTIEDIRLRLGHADLKTTQGYLTKSHNLNVQKEAEAFGD
jgi:integrase